MRSLAFLILLCSCAPSRTPCGLQVSSDWLTEGDATEAEGMVLAAAEQLGVSDRTAACAEFSKYHLTTREPGLWTTQTVDGPAEVDGLTNCKDLSIIVARAEKWQFSSLAHELFHVVTHCDGHRAWTEQGITQALIDIYFTGIPDSR